MYLDKNVRMNAIKRNLQNKKFIKEEIIKQDHILSNVCGYSLDKEQRIAVVTDEDATLILAGAGSGKSLTMIGKIKYLINAKNIDPSDILCITFTREAASSLKNKLKIRENIDIEVYTFHKLALNILKNKYKICSEGLLQYIVDEYFNCLIKNNKSMINNLKLVLNMIDTPYSYIIKSKELQSLKKLIITFINLFKTNNRTYSDFLNYKKYKRLMAIIIDIYYLYEEELKSTNCIDFNDMITLATKEVKYRNLKYKYIIVDEYQDTSYTRYLLLKEIKDKTKAKLICVGDDYQSIYRFNGCDISMFLNFNKYFKKSKTLKINNTYRNSQELINVAGSFIMKNKNQKYKKLRSNKHISKPIKIMYSNHLSKLLDRVIEKYDEILVLGRNNFDISKYFKIDKNNYFFYKGKKIKFMTVHASKGLESECVIIINNTDDTLGFPNKIKDDKILEMVKRKSDNYPYSEERRLFYVAMTRTRNELFLLVDRKIRSIFIKELIKEYDKYIEYI